MSDQNSLLSGLDDAPDAESKPAEGVTYTKPASQIDLEERLANGNAVSGLKVKTLSPAEQLDEAKDGYVGTDPIYQNHANETEKPYAAEEGADKLAEEAFLSVSKAEVNEDEANEGVAAAASLQAGDTAAAPAPSTTRSTRKS